MFQREQEVAGDRSQVAARVHLVKSCSRSADITVGEHGAGTIDRSGSGTTRSGSSTLAYLLLVQGFGAGSKYEKGLAFDMIAQAAAA